MTVLVLTTGVLFLRGGAETLRDRLVSQLQAANVDAEAIGMPFTWIPSEGLIEEMLMASKTPEIEKCRSRDRFKVSSLSCSV
jgi:hypothetical protein